MVLGSFLDGFWHPNLRDKSFQKQPYATRHPSYAVRYTLYHTNNLWDKSFQKQALGQIVPKTTLGQIVPKKKRPNKFSPPSPLKKKGPGVLPAKWLNPPHPLRMAGVWNCSVLQLYSLYSSFAIGLAHSAGLPQKPPNITI